MHDIEPFYNWHDLYKSEKDKRSPFYGRVYDEFYYTQKVYNYFIHPLWDEFGSQTLYLKVLYADYNKGCIIIELLGEWNDAINNDVMFLKREVADEFIAQGIYKFILVAENVLNFHADDDSYYEEWWDDIKEDEGWIILLNTTKHVEEEMESARLQYYVNFGGVLSNLNWRRYKPKDLCKVLTTMMEKGTKTLGN